jgi:hypothetical protein
MMMKIKSALFILFILASFLLRAETNEVQNAEQESWEILRDPFWPVGYVPPERQKTMPVVSNILNDQVKWPKLEMKGVTKLKDGSYVVFLKEHGMAEVGDIITVEQTGLIYEFETTDISKAGLKYKKKKFSSVKQK